MEGTSAQEVEQAAEEQGEGGQDSHTHFGGGPGTDKLGASTEQNAAGRYGCGGATEPAAEAVVGLEAAILEAKGAALPGISEGTSRYARGRAPKTTQEVSAEQKWLADSSGWAGSSHVPQLCRSH